LNGARLRLRSILMTSFAFILGLLPLWYALGAGGVARRLIGTVTIVGMIFSSGIAIFLCLRSSLWLSDTDNAYEVEKFEQKPTAEAPRLVAFSVGGATSRRNPTRLDRESSLSQI
jgi:AcrB/AcrD/AcrF family